MANLAEDDQGNNVCTVYVYICIAMCAYCDEGGLFLLSFQSVTAIKFDGCLHVSLPLIRHALAINVLLLYC